MRERAERRPEPTASRERDGEKIQRQRKRQIKTNDRRRSPRQRQERRNFFNVGVYNRNVGDARRKIATVSKRDADGRLRQRRRRRYRRARPPLAAFQSLLTYFPASN